MFEGIKNFIGRIRNMFNKTVISKEFNINISTSNEMENAISMWINQYMNKPPWKDDETVFSMNLAAGIASEFAKLVTIEFKSKISNNDFLDKEYQKVVDKIRNITELACASGAVVLKPYVVNGHIAVDVVQADGILPVDFNSNGEMTAVILPERKVVGDTIYTRLEYHSFNASNNTYSIENKAYRKKNMSNSDMNNNSVLGDPIDLTDVEDWQNLAPQITISNIERPLFSYFKMPLANNVDTSSPLGVSVYSRVAEPNGLMQKADEQYSRILWEFEGTEIALDVSRDFFRSPENNNTFELPKGKERLYRGLEITGEEKTSGWNIFSPQIRETSLFNGLNQLIRKIEFQVGLAYGTLSDANESDKTATEVKASKQRSFQTVQDIQKALRLALETLAYAMYVMGSIEGLAVKPINFEDENAITFDFDDSILVDKDKENDSMYLDVSGGIISNIYYIMKKYKVTEEEAKKMMPVSQEIVTENQFDKGLDPNTGMPMDQNTNDDSIVDTVEEVANKQLNGAQTQSLIAVISQYTEGTLTIGQAINVISIAIGVSKEEAKGILEGAI